VRSHRRRRTAVYSGASWITSLIALDQVSSYTNWVLALISLSLLLLTAGVVVLSSKKPDAGPPKRRPRTDALEEGDGDGDAVSMTEPAPAAAKRSTDGAAGSSKRTSALLAGESSTAGETVWEVGEASADLSDDELDDLDRKDTAGAGYGRVQAVAEDDEDDEDFGAFVADSGAKR
jgi:hypothetical protein